MTNTEESNHSWLDYPLSSWFKLNWESAIFITILILGIFSRFYDLGTRVMSHDETSHVYFSWRLEQGMGYQHDPVTHGPFQFHLVALSYFLFGDNDFTARIPAALFSVATIGFMWFYRRYLGRIGALVGGFLFLISPYFLYYGRYVRNEAFVGLFGVMTLWAILRYLEEGNTKYLFLLTIVTSLQFATKETAFIYTAQALVFLGLYLVFQVSKKPWDDETKRHLFLISLIIAFILLGLAGTGALVFKGENVTPLAGTESIEIPNQNPNPNTLSGNSIILITMAVLGLVAGLVSLFYLIKGYTWERLCKLRAFDLII
ncbi:MAG: flippase activity-associated protein Agl23, partial [Anaerolineaceae bacterium]